MKKILLFVVLLAGLQIMKANAAITVTAGTGGTGICANLAQTGITPAFTTLTPIVITEALNGDITTGFHALVINAPAGWRFNTGATPTFTFTAGRNVVFVNAGTFTAGSLTINIVTTGNTLLDAVTITGLQVQATTTGSGAGNITASAAPGMTGITTGGGGTNFGSLSLTPSLTPSVAIAANPGASVCAGTTVTFTATPTNGGTPTYQWQVNGAPVAGATNTTFSSGTLVSGNTVRVVMTATGCRTTPTATSTAITMSINALPAAVSVSTAGTYCNNTTLNATLAGPGTIYFQGVTSNGTSTATPSSAQFITNPGSHTYYFRAQSAGCWGPEGSAKVTINLQPSAITITPATSATLCLGDSAAFIASATAPSVEILQEDFNAGLGAWTITNVAGVPNSFWQIRNPPGWLNATTGDGSPFIQGAPDAAGSGNNTTTILTSPSFSLVGYNSASVSFNQFYRAYNAGTDRDFNVAVDYSIDGGLTWTPILDQAGTVPSNSTIGATSWVSTTPNLSVGMPAPALGQPNVQLRWHYNSTFGWYWGVDNIAVTGIPQLAFSWVGVSGAAGLSCSTCDTVMITPAAAGVSVYTVSSTLSGCTTVAGLTITVNALPAIFDVTGGGTICAGGPGANIGLSGSEVGVDYQLYLAGAPVGAVVSGTGIALDFGPQTAAGTYSVVAGNLSTTCSEIMNGTVDVIVNPAPNAFNVTGTATFCAGDTGTHIGLDGSDPGIRYQLFSGATAVGTILDGTGAALDFGLFTASGTYTVLATDTTTLCTAAMTGSAVVLENPLPTIYDVTGGGGFCTGDPGVSVGLNGSAIGVNYQLYFGAAPVGAALPGSGLALDFGLQTAVGTYTVMATDGTTACFTAMNDSAVVVENPLPASITGVAIVCENATTTLASTTPGGAWSSSDVTIATVNATSGVVTGTGAGIANITYALPTTCYVMQPVTVNPAPFVDVIAGITNQCAGDTTTLTNATSGGVWSSAATSIASINAASGLVTAVSGGITTVSYTITDGLGCSASATTPDTVTAFPVLGAIGGPTGVCVGSSVTLTNTTAGGAWSSSDATIGSIDAVSGVLDGISAGTITVSYAVIAGPGCTTTVSDTATVNPLPVIAGITGPDNVCAGLSITLASATAGGVWTSSNTAIASVNTGGVVSGVAVGIATLTYTVTTAAGCSDFVTYDITVGNAMPAVGLLPSSPSVTLCGGNPVNLVSSTAGTITYQWSEGGTDIVGATNSSYVATTPGVYALTVDNGTCTATLPSKNVIADPNAVITFNTSGGYLYTGSFATYQWYRNGTAIAGATSSILTSPVAGDFTVVVGDINACPDTSAVYTIASSGVNNTTSDLNISIYPNPATSVIYIDAPVKVNVSVLAPDGRLVIGNKAGNSVNIGGLSNGVYLIQIFDEHNTLLRTERFVKAQ